MKKTTQPHETKEKKIDWEGLCKHCGIPIKIGANSKFCDHLYYPENCKICIAKLLKKEDMTKSTEKKEKKCEATEGCRKKIAYTITDHKLKKTANLCIDHFEHGMKAWLEKDPIIKQLMHEGIL